MFHRIKILFKLQFSSRRKTKNIKSKSTLQTLGMNALIFLAVTAVFIGLFYLLKKYISIEINMNVLIFLVGLTQIFSIISGTVELSKELYEPRDLNVLLSLPVNKEDVLISKLLIFYQEEVKRCLLFLAPLLIGYGIYHLGQTPWYYYFLVVSLFLFFPLFNVLISAIIGFIVSAIKMFVQRFKLVKLFGAILLYALIAVLLYFILEKVPNPLRILQLYNSFIISLSSFIEKACKYIIFYQNLVGVIFLKSVLKNLFIALAYLFGVIAVATALLYPFYYKVIWRNNESTVTNKGVVKKNTFHKNTFTTFFLKEFKLNTRDTTTLVKTYVLLIFLPLIIYALNQIYFSISLTELGLNLTLIFNVVVILFVSTGSNTESACIISKEGLEFSLIKTAPTKAKNIVWAKLLFNFIITTIMLTATFLVLFFKARTFFSLDTLLYLLFGILFFNISHILWSAELDIINPRINEYNEVGNSSSNPNVKEASTLSVLISLVAIVILVGSIFFLKTYAFLIFIVIASIFLAYRFYHINKIIKIYFNEIEF
ncbi:MAG: hypothetical protein LBV51_03095 [Acholeplasmatales bacterium]|jgi:hypothetical protein|nr:hypothetical protein [Acholeplasmatales bacterium]